MRIGTSQLWLRAAVGIGSIWASVALASPMHNAFPPLPQVIPMMPPTVLYGDTQGEILFKSSSPYDLDVLLSQPSSAQASMGVGKLSLPPQASQEKPVPAVIILPGSAGVVPGRENEMVKTLNDQGIAVFVLDNLKPRGITPSMPSDVRLMGASEFDSVADAYAALRTLNKHLAIDPQRIGLLGFSKGGIAARMSMDERIYEKLAPDVPAFALHVDFYGPCYARMPIRSTTKAPLISFRAGRDASTDLKACAAEETVLREAGSDVNAVVYVRAGHDWDSSEPAGMNQLPYMKQGCTIAFDSNNMPTLHGRQLIPVDAKPDRETRYQIRVKNSKNLGDCVKVGYVSGRDDSARKLSTQQLLQFLKQHFKL